uniref:Uncharacterized protein n=1 Tax=Arundo donax TaxID=35708 RepID=A0A0A8YK23_ARUDO
MCNLLLLAPFHHFLTSFVFSCSLYMYPSIPSSANSQARFSSN